MSFKTTYILFLVFLGLIASFFLTQLFSGKPGDDTYIMPDLHAARVKPSEIDTIEIERFGAQPEKLVFVRDPVVDWKMVQPAELQVDAQLVDRMLFQVHQGRREEKDIDISPNLATHGLDQPQMRVTLKKKEGGGEWWLNIGNKSPGPDFSAIVYATSSAKPRAPMGVKHPAIDLVFKKVNDFRARDLLTSSALNVTYVNLQDPKKPDAPLILEKGTAGRWVFVQPEYGEAEYEGEPSGLQPQPVGQKKITGVRDLIEAVEHIRIGEDSDFVTEHATDLAQYGLEGDKPETFRVEIKRRVGGLLGGDDSRPPLPATLLVGKPADEKGEKYYARLASEPHVVVKVPKASIEPLMKTLADPSQLRNRDLLTLDIKRVDAIDGQSRDRGAYQLRKVDNVWKLVDRDKLLDVDDNEVDRLLEALTARRQVREFPPASQTEAELGLDRPAASVSLWVDGVLQEENKPGAATKPAATPPKLRSAVPTARLVLGKEDKDLVFVQREIDRQTSRVAVPAALLGKVAVSKLHFLAKDLVQLHNRLDISRIVITRGMDVVELRKDGSDWKLEKPANLAGRPADRAKIGPLLDDLESLVPVRYVTDAPSDSDMARFGLSDPPLKIGLTITREGKPEEVSYLFGNEDDARTGVYGKKGDGSLVYLIRPEVVRQFPRDFADTTVLRYDTDQVKRIKLTGWQKVSGTPEVLELERKGRQSWAAVTPPMFPVDSKKVEDFVDRLRQRKALKFAVLKTGSLPPHELEVGQGALDIAITVEGEKEPLILTIGARQPADEGYYARCNRLPGDVFIWPEELVKDVLKGRGYFSSQP